MGYLAVVICNFNGGQYTVDCIKAVQKSTYNDWDIIVVDNASTDGSVELLTNEFGDSITILLNDTNRGGAGGFGRGLRYATEKNYEYIMMLDNDAFVDEHAIEILMNTIKEDESIGIVGAKILCLDDRNIIMDFAKKMDWDSFIDYSVWVGQEDSEKSRISVECDFVAATASIVRREALVRSGGMDEEHFIYYDDIELNQRIRMAGYRVVACGEAKAWHKSSMATNKTNTFARYYLTRNRYRFFAKYLPEDKLEKFADYVIEQSFPYLYGSNHNGREDMFLTTKYIMEDFMNDVRGVAGPRRIQTIINVWEKNLSELIGKNKRIAIYLSESARQSTYQKITDYLDKKKDEIEYELVESIDAVSTHDLVLVICDHVKEQHENILPVVYIDAYGNVVKDWQSYIYFQNYENVLELFRHYYKDSILQGIANIRNK